MAEQKLNVVVSLVDDFSKGLNSFSEKIKSHEATFKGMAKWGTAAFAGITGAIGLSVKAFAESEAQLTRVDTILGKMSETTLKQFSGGIDQAKQIAREFGQELQDMGGISAEAASEGFAKFLQVTGDSSKAMEYSSLAADLATAKQIDYDTAVKAVTKTLNGNNKELQMLGIQVDDQTTREEALAKMAEAVGGQYEAYGKTISGQTAIMKESFGDLTEAIGGAFAPVLQKINEFMLPVIQSFTEWATENPKLLAAIVGVVAGLAALVAIAGTLGLILPSITAGFIALGGALTFLAANPIVLVIAAIAALVAGLIWLWKNSEEVNQYVSASLQVLSDFFISIWTSIKDFFVGVWTEIAAFFVEVWNTITAPFIAGLNMIQFLWTTVWTGASNLFTSVWEGIKSTGSAGIEWFVGLFTSAVSKIGQAFGAIWEGAKNVMSGIFESIKGIVKGILNWIIEKMNWVIDKINFVTQAAAILPGVKKSDTQISKIPALAQGGIVTRPTIAMIGEAGAEAVIPLSKMNNRGSINITITGNSFLGGTAREAAVEIGRLLVKELRPNASFN